MDGMVLFTMDGCGHGMMRFGQTTMVVDRPIHRAVDLCRHTTVVPR